MLQSCCLFITSSVSRRMHWENSGHHSNKHIIVKLCRGHFQGYKTRWLCHLWNLSGCGSLSDAALVFFKPWKQKASLQNQSKKCWGLLQKIPKNVLELEEAEEWHRSSIITGPGIYTKRKRTCQNVASTLEPRLTKFLTMSNMRVFWLVTPEPPPILIEFGNWVLLALFPLIPNFFVAMASYESPITYTPVILRVNRTDAQGSLQHSRLQEETPKSQ